jgi:hypothetical protein
MTTKLTLEAKLLGALVTRGVNRSILEVSSAPGTIFNPEEIFVSNHIKIYHAQPLSQEARGVLASAVRETLHKHAHEIALIIIDATQGNYIFRDELQDILSYLSSEITLAIRFSMPEDGGELWLNRKDLVKQAWHSWMRIRMERPDLRHMAIEVGGDNHERLMYGILTRGWGTVFPNRKFNPQFIDDPVVRAAVFGEVSLAAACELISDGGAI